MTAGSRFESTALPKEDGRGRSDRPDDAGSAIDRLAFELGTLLHGALRGLVEATEATHAEAWALDRRGQPFLAARHATADERDEAESGDSAPPDAAALAALWRLPGATDLTEPGIDALLERFARARGLGVVAPLFTRDSESEDPRPIAAIFLGFAPATAGARFRVRPRTLAELNDVVSRLRGPAETAAEVARLSELDDEVLRVTRLATIGDLLAEVVHEVRNPLVSVKTFLQLLPDNLDDVDFTTNFRGVVIEEVRRMERLLDAVLLQARPAPETEAEQSAELGTILESVGRLLEQRALEKELGLTIDIGADLPPAATAEDPLRQIVLNLALNALEATPEGGKVRLTAARSSLDGAAALDFIVDDEGPGVPEEQRIRLFDPFFSTRSQRPGGLGLTVCRRLAHEAGGRITVEDSPAGGARLRVTIPALA